MDFLGQPRILWSSNWLPRGYSDLGVKKVWLEDEVKKEVIEIKEGGVKTNRYRKRNEK